MNALEVILAEPWLITESGLALMIAIASRDEFFDDVRKEALAARAGEPLDNTHKVTKRDGVAVIPVTGPLFRHANMMTRLSGATSYATLRTDLQAALDDASVRAILLSIDSPGGDANGVAELSGAIFEARGKKPITAYVGGSGASAAYWLAAAASEIVASPTAELGSIGAVMAMEVEDATTASKRIVFVSNVSPDKRLDPLSKAGRVAMQRRADDLGEVFVDGVAKYRGVTKADVLERFGRGGVMIASRAVAAGLADRVGDFESTLAALAGKRSSFPSMGPQARGEQTMNKLIAFLGLAAASSEDDCIAAITERERRSTQALEEAKRGSALAVGEAEKLAARLSTLEDDKWSTELAALRDDFRITPAEMADYAALAGAEREVARKLLVKRPAQKPAGDKVELKTGPSGVEAKQLAAESAIEVELKADPSIDPATAMKRAAEKQPALFTQEGA